MSIARPVQRAAFFGAGLSRPSGQPLVHEFMGGILEELGLPKDRIEELRSIPIPFELFMQTLAERTEIAPLLEIFEIGQPNFYHHALAELARAGSVRTFITTNFDALLEQAFQEVGLGPGSDFLVYDEPSKFGRIRWETKKLIVVKLHGSVTSKEPLGVTLERVASRASAVGIRRALAPLLSGRRCEAIFVAGYSFSDAFDVTPVMRGLEPWRVEITHLDHRPDVLPADRRAFAAPPNLSQKVRRVSGRTEAYFRRVAAQHRLSDRTRANSTKVGPSASLLLGIRAWAASMPKARRKLQRQYTLARLLYRYGRFEAALVEIYRLMESARRMNAKRWEAEAYLNAGIFHYRLGQYRQAVRLAARAVRASRRGRHHRVLSNALGNLGNGLYALNRLESALRWQGRAAKAAQAIGYSELLANTHGNIGIIHEAAGRLGLAVQNHKRAIRVATKIGDALGLARHTGNIALCLNKMNRPREAEVAAQRALDLARLTTQPHIEAAAHAELARAWAGTKPAEAKEAIGTAVALSAVFDPGSEPRYFRISAEISLLMGCETDARALLATAIEKAAARYGPQSSQAKALKKKLHEMPRGMIQ